MLTSQVVPLILSVMDGYPSLLLAYGELASGWNFSNFIPSTIIIIIMKYHPGKSTTLFGSQGNPGVLRRCLREMFRFDHVAHH